MNCIKKYLLACLAILLLFIQAQAQTSGKKTVRGYVRDEDGEPIPGAFVQVQGSNTGTLTNADGYYEISINSDQLLVYSFIGSVTQTLKTGNRTTVNVVLEKDVEQLEDAVVVAFGSQKKVTITGSIATVSSTELKKTDWTTLLPAELPVLRPCNLPVVSRVQTERPCTCVEHLPLTGKIH